MKITDIDIKECIALLAAKLSILACKCIGRSGTSLSGKLAQKIDRDILAKLSKGCRIIMVTGTNGKTTTTKMISEILRVNGVEHITNRSGANLISGITSTFIRAVDMRGRCGIKTALLEVDEATVGKVTRWIKPDVMVVTNFFRDQLDRYGELTAVVDKVRLGIERSPDAKLVLNADDSLCASLGRDVGNKVLYYGVEEGAVEGIVEKGVQEASYCLYCKTKYEYSYRVYGHFGGYRCPGCGYSRPDTQVGCEKVLSLNPDGSSIDYRMGGEMRELTIHAPGLYNIYNALAAAACGELLGFPAEKSAEAFGNFVSCFGRMETIDVGGKTLRVILTKNPAGFNQILNYLSLDERKMNLSILINDRTADGNDISWLWDVEFEKMTQFAQRIEHVYVSGLRAEDMALRLKYAGIDTAKTEIIKDYEKLVERGLEATAPGGTFYIVSNYTAMMDIRRMLRKKYGLKEFWE